jgi:hypothetical protein
MVTLSAQSMTSSARSRFTCLRSQGLTAAMVTANERVEKADVHFSGNTANNLARPDDGKFERR